MRVISADALIMKEVSPGVYLIDGEAIRNAPTFDAEPVRHGHWIETIENGKMKRVTSCCGDDQTTLTCWYTPRYCPNCGAKMEKHFHEVWKKVDGVKE